MLTQLVRFLMVGSVGFAADAFVLWMLLYPLEMGLMVSRVIAWAVAISITFVMNARFTFEVAARESRLVRYIAIQSLGAGINFGTYGALVLGGPLMELPMVAFALAAGLATTSNFTLARFFVYPGSHLSPEERDRLRRQHDERAKAGTRSA